MRLTFLRWLILCLLPMNAMAQDVPGLPSIVVMADSNLSLPLAEIARNYSREHQVAIALALSSQQDSTAQIAEGNTADVLITARPAWLEMLKQQGLVDIYSEAAVASDQLALVGQLPTPIKLSHTLPTPQIITAMHGEPLFALGNPEYISEGAAARDALRKLGADADLEPYTVYLKSRKEIYDIVRSGGFAIIRAADAQMHGLNVLDYIPDTSHTPIAYKAVVLAGDKMDLARTFLDYLKSRDAQVIFFAYGFK